MSAPKHTILELLELERIDRDLFRANATTGEAHALYGGQVAAQALRAAGMSVAPGFRPHSLHGYFLRKGEATAPTVFQVHRDRDGRSFQARRVVALQDGEVIFSMSTSFQMDSGATAVDRADPAPLSGVEGPLWDGFPRLVSVEVRVPEQPYPTALWPTRAWVRVNLDLPADALLHACVLTYLSDMTTGNLPCERDGAQPGPSIDHAVWFHTPADLNRWTLIDCHPRAAGGGRGWYVGSMFDDSGNHLASLAQESLLRPVPGGGAQ